jgi:hypothetical protein
MKQDPLLSVQIFEPIPNPTTEELEAAPTRWKGFRDWEWRHFTGWMAYLNNAEIWEDYTEEIDNQLGALFVEDELEDIPVPALETLTLRSNTFTLEKNGNEWVEWESVELDELGAWDTGNPTRLTATKEGRYRITGSVSFQQEATGRRRIGITKNAARTLISDTNQPAASTGNHVMQTVRTHTLAVGEYVELRVFQDSANDLLIQAGISQTWLSLLWIGEVT